jgi:hypothetical protein
VCTQYCEGKRINRVLVAHKILYKDYSYRNQKNQTKINNLQQYTKRVRINLLYFIFYRPENQFNFYNSTSQIDKNNDRYNQTILNKSIA